MLGTNEKLEEFNMRTVLLEDEIVLKDLLVSEVIYQTRETVFHRDIQTPRRELKIRRAAEYFR